MLFPMPGSPPRRIVVFSVHSEFLCAVNFVDFEWLDGFFGICLGGIPAFFFFFLDYFFGDGIPFFAGVALSLPFGVWGAAVLAEEGGFYF